MIYFNIHTHKQSNNLEDIAIISVDIRKPFELINSTHTFYSVGVHPWHINTDDQEAANRLFTRVRQLALFPEVVAIGETGLDKNTAHSAIDFILQREIFMLHARLSEEVRKPLIIHCVKAWNDLLCIRQSIKPSMSWIIHGFRGKEPLAARLLKTGFYLSFGIHYHIDTLKEAWKIRRMFLETDDKNVDIRDVYQQVASDLNVSEQELSDEIQVFLMNNFFGKKQQ